MTELVDPYLDAEHGCLRNRLGIIDPDELAAKEHALVAVRQRQLHQRLGPPPTTVDQHSAELLFQILTEREERAAIAIASNAPFSGWSKTFTAPRLAAAVVDRITYRAHIIQTGTDSYRLNKR